jgi:protein-L-isoaspartate(D-aspartate) O-methyltransferase
MSKLSFTTKQQLIEPLILASVLKTRRVIKAFEEVDRKHFVPIQFRDDAYGNFPLPIGHGQTISQPYTVALMLELLDVKAGDKVLEIGAGSGWQTALLAFLAGEKGKVFGMEFIPELANLAEVNLLKAGWRVNHRTSTLVRRKPKISAPIKLILGDGSKGYSAEAPYDRIIAAASGKQISEAWKEQLKIGGRLVCPVKESLIAVDKLSPEKFKIKEIPGFLFVPLVGGE